jgi:hypothetical protein
LRKTLILAGALAALLAAIAAGCGGGGGGGLSKEEYVSKLNAICIAADERGKEIGEPQSREEFIAKAPRIIDVVGETIGDAKDLGGPPDEIAEPANRFIEIVERQVEIVEDLLDAARNNDSAKSQELAAEFEQLSGESDEIATRLGAPDCAEDGTGRPQLTKEEYASQLNALCEGFNRKQEEIGAPQSLAELGEKGDQILDEFNKTIDKARDLKPPDEIADQANRFIDIGVQQRDLIKDVIQAAKDNDLQKAQEIGAKIEPLDAESDRIATQLGAPACTAD